MTPFPSTPPRDPKFDSSLDLLRYGYAFIRRRAGELGADVFETRLGLLPVICMTGPDAAELLYDQSRFRRAGALPEPVLSTIIGHRGVQSLDGDAHLRRKALLMSFMQPASVAALGRGFEAAWEAALPDWARRGKVTLLPSLEPIIARAVCAWAGVPLPDRDVEPRTRMMTTQIDGGASLGLRHLRGRVARHRGNAWIGGLAEEVRAGRSPDIPPPDGLEQTPLVALARHRDLDGQLLDPEVVAVDLQSLLRPTVAVARYITFAALALHRHPEWRERLRGADDDLVRAFVLEVRRMAPFFPVIAARTRRAFAWRGIAFPADRLTLLDVYGTNRDARSWDEPDRFRPERFLGWRGDPFAMIPQGGGDHHVNHRCAGEWITIDLMSRGVRMLVDGLDYEVPEQDLRVTFRRMPTGPRSGFRLTRVRRSGGHRTVR